MSDKIEPTTLREQSEKLFRRRLLYALHIIVFIGVMVLTRGRLVRYLPVLEIWVLLILAHTVYLALYESFAGRLRKADDEQAMREREERAASQRQEEAYARNTVDIPVSPDDPVEKAKREDEAQGGDGYYTIGSDGELIPLSEAEAEAAEAGEARKDTQQG